MLALVRAQRARQHLAWHAARSPAGPRPRPSGGVIPSPHRAPWEPRRRATPPHPRPRTPRPPPCPRQGNFHFAAGRSYQQGSVHVHDQSPFESKALDFSHKINRLSFGPHYPGHVNPLDGASSAAVAGGGAGKVGMYQYFLKVGGDNKPANFLLPFASGSGERGGCGGQSVEAHLGSMRGFLGRRLGLQVQGCQPLVGMRVRRRRRRAPQLGCLTLKPQPQTKPQPAPRPPPPGGPHPLRVRLQRLPGQQPVLSDGALPGDAGAGGVPLHLHAHPAGPLLLLRP